MQIHNGLQRQQKKIINVVEKKIPKREYLASDFLRCTHNKISQYSLNRYVIDKSRCLVNVKILQIRRFAIGVLRFGRRMQLRTQLVGRQREPSASVKISRNGDILYMHVGFHIKWLFLSCFNQKQKLLKISQNIQ